jgi:hypothetical protein
VLDWVKAIRIDLIDSFFANSCKKAVLCGDFEVFIARFGCPIVILDAKALNPGDLLFDK